MSVVPFSTRPQPPRSCQPVTSTHRSRRWMVLRWSLSQPTLSVLVERSPLPRLSHGQRHTSGQTSLRLHEARGAGAYRVGKASAPIFDWDPCLFRTALLQEFVSFFFLEEIPFCPLCAWTFDRFGGRAAVRHHAVPHISFEATQAGGLAPQKRKNRRTSWASARPGRPPFTTVLGRRLHESQLVRGSRSMGLRCGVLHPSSSSSPLRRGPLHCLASYENWEHNDTDRRLFSPCPRAWRHFATPEAAVAFFASF